MSWLLIPLVGLALLSFILMDANFSFGGGNNNVGSINGEDISYELFNDKLRSAYRGQSTGHAQINQVWSYFLDTEVVCKEARAMGLGVSDAEMDELLFGVNRSPIIVQAFTNPNTGQIDVQALEAYRTKTNADGTAMTNDQLKWWSYVKELVSNEKLKEKYLNIAVKGLNVPSWEAEMMADRNTEVVDFAYVKIPYLNIDDSKVNPTDADYKKYIKENQAKLESKEEQRRVSYVVFDVVPTSEDSLDVKNEVAKIATLMGEAEDDALFAQSYAGQYSDAYVEYSTLSSDIKEAVEAAENGTVVGPYLDGSQYKVAKVLDKKVIADSVRARHILLNATNQEELIAVTQALETYKSQVENNEMSFDSLAIKYSVDGSASAGGDLGMKGRATGFVPQFENSILYNLEEGEMEIVYTQFGAHLIQVTEKKYISNDEMVKVSYVGRNIIPSSNTLDEAEVEAINFIDAGDLDALRAMATEKNIAVRSSNAFKSFDNFLTNLGTDSDARNIIRWAFGNDRTVGTDVRVGDVSSRLYSFRNPVSNATDKFVVVALESVIGEGVPSVAEAKVSSELNVVNMLKGEMMKNEVKGTDLASIAKTYGVAVDTARNVNFSTSLVAGLGSEPTVIANAFASTPNQVSPVIVGKSGVFVIMPLTAPRGGQADVTGIKRSSLSQIQGQVRTRLVNEVKADAKVNKNLSLMY
jgi:peptidyl-prolyl cis-trans isomerase D